MGRKSNETIVNEFFDKNREYLVKAPDKLDQDESICFLWDNNPKEVVSKLNEISNDIYPGRYCYTLIEEDGKAYIVPEWHVVNRLGYFVSTREVDPDMPSIRYW